ncbi:MAG: 30S ribosomal protein S27e [Candidatus Hodarchaeales archaeon]
MRNKRISRSRFKQVKCKCGFEQNVFSHSSSVVYCQVCNQKLVIPTGGKARIKGQVMKTWNN